MMYVEKKWQTNMEKVAFAKSFPGRLMRWDAAVGKKVERTVAIDEGRTGMVLFDDGTFIFIPAPDPAPADLIRTLLAGRSFLERYHQGAYTELDRWIATDKEMQRMARLENILGAIRNNLPQIPELKEKLKQFLEEDQ
jgi:hypothetical protein